MLMPREPPAGSASASTDGDLPWSAARGLLATDSARGAYYVVESLWRARRDGDVHRMARAAAIVGSVILTPAGGMFARWGSTLTEFARSAGRQLASDYLLGLVDICEGNQRILEGRWQDALDLCERGLQKLHRMRGDIAWERNLGEMAAIRALEELGLLVEAGSRAAEVLDVRVNAGDLFGHVTALLYLGQAELIIGSPTIASEFADRVATLWQAPTYTMQHLYTMRLRALCALSTGDLDRAAELVESEWPKLARSGLMHLPPVHLDAHRIRGQVLLACGRTAEARASIRALDRDAPAHARPLGWLLESAVFESPRERGDLAQRATAAFDGLGMRVAARCSEWHVADAMGDEEKRRAVEGVLAKCGVASPTMWAALQAPRAAAFTRSHERPGTPSPRDDHAGSST
jgi:hypothetical protein